MAVRVYRIAVVGCPRAVIEPLNNGSFSGVGKSCFCNRFVKPEAYAGTHNSVVSAEQWADDGAISGDHFLYWGATTRHLHDGSRARFQVVEQTEFYDSATAADETLQPHPSSAGYVERAASVRIATSSCAKVAVRLKAEQASARAGGVRSTTQTFPNDDFGGKQGGIMGFACVFDPTLVEEQMKRQMVYLASLLQGLSKTKKKVALVCTKCDVADEKQIKMGAGLAVCALRKPIPFFEVSSQDGVNVEDVFFSLIGHAKKLPKIPKSPKSSRHASVSGSHVSYKEAVSLHKHDIHRAKDAYRRLLQQKITSFSSVWSEVYLMLEKEEAFSLLLQLAGKDGKDIVKNMFCLRLIEIKLTEGAKLFGVSSASKKLNKEKSMDYQHYLSDALKSHPDLRNESVYDYVYSPGTSLDDTSSHIYQPSISSDTTSDSRSTCNTPDYQASLPVTPIHLANGSGHTHSATMPDLADRSKQAPAALDLSARATHSVDMLSSYSPHPSPLPQTSQSTHSVYNYGSDPHLIDSASGLPASGSVRHSQPILDVIPPPLPPPPAQSVVLGRLSNSMDTLGTLAGEQDTDTLDYLNAEPYLQPKEVQMMMHTLPRTYKLPESTSYHSIRESQPTTRSQLPIRTSAIEVSDMLQISTRQSMAKHRRTASNPWVLEGGCDEPHATGPPVQSFTLPSSLPPPVPARDYHRNSKSPPQLSSSNLHPKQSSLDFPQENQRSVSSVSLSPVVTSAPTPQPEYADIDEMDNLSNISGPFEEISDDPDSPAAAPGASNRKKGSGKSKTTTAISLAHLEQTNSDYEKIEEYVTMAPSPLARRSMIVNETPKPTERTPKKTTSKSVVPPPKAKKPKGWTRQNTDSVIPNAADIRSSSPPLFPSRRSTMFDGSPQRAVTLSSSRPLPPSPSKSVSTSTKSALRRNSSDGSNIYESIDEEMLNRVKPRRRGSGLPKWAPPVDPAHYAQYMVILRKFFTDPKIIAEWEKTVREIIPGANVATYPPPYSNLPRTQDQKLATTVEVPQTKGGDEPTPKGHHQAVLAREGSNDQYVLPVLKPPKAQMQSKSTPVTPASSPARVLRRGDAMSSGRVRFAMKRPASREDMIASLNMNAFQGDSSESESDGSGGESEDEMDEEEEEGEGESEGEEEEEGVKEGEGGKEGEEESVGGEEEDSEGGEEGGKGEVERGSGTEEGAVATAAGRGYMDGEEVGGDAVGSGDTMRNTRASPESNPSPDQRPSVTDADLDSILTTLNPILSSFESILAEPDFNDAPPHDSVVSKDRDSDLRASVSTDSDLDSLIKPSSLFQKHSSSSGSSRVLKWVNAFEQEGTEEREKQRGPAPVPKRKPMRRRDVAIDGMSDSGISNCHSQTYDDGFNPIDTN